jgi:hypothetical protein
MQAAAAFAAEAAAMPAAHAAAQEELMGAGAALIEVARMYEQVDVEAAGTLVSSANQFTSQAFATGAASVGAGLTRAEALPGALGSAARTPLMANLIEGVAASNPSTTAARSRERRLNCDERRQRPVKLDQPVHINGRGCRRQRRGGADFAHWRRREHPRRRRRPANQRPANRRPANQRPATW